MGIYRRGGCDKKGPNNTCSKCGKKRGKCGVYWYKFMWNGEMVRESTRQKNEGVARNMESAHRRDWPTKITSGKRRQYS